MQLSGFITGTLAYSLKRDFLANAIALREVETLNYDIYSIDFSSFSANTIQNQIKNQFSGVYSGDINVTVVNTQNTFSYPSDSLRAARFNVTVELRKPVANLSSMFPELSSGYYSGLGASFFTGYGQYLLDFKENFTFATNNNGNREYNHEIGFGLRTGFANSANITGRKSFAQTIASGIYSQDKNTNLGYATLVGQIGTLADSGVSKNFFTETYDLMKNTYSFNRRREFLPSDGTQTSINFNHNVNLNPDGSVDVTEKGSLQAKIDFSAVRNDVENYAASSFARCNNIYSQFYNSSVIMQDSQYSVVGGVFPLQNLPIKTVKIYDAKNMSASYEVVYTNNQKIQTSDAVSISTILEFNIDAHNKIEASHSSEIIADRVKVSENTIYNYIATLSGVAPLTMSDYYANNFGNIYNTFPNLNLIKTSANISKFKSSASAKFFFSNNPSYFTTENGVTFKIFEYSVDEKKPADIVNEYKVVARPTQTSVMSYAYQTDKGEVAINLKTCLGKQTSAFYPDGIGNFSQWNGVNMNDALTAIYKTAGQIFMDRFTSPCTALNWFISDSKFSMDNNGNLNAQINYVYTIKKRLIGGNE